MAAALGEVCQEEQLELLAIPSAVDWREVAALLAVGLGGSVTSEVTELRRAGDGTLLADRLFYSGLVVATVAMLASPAVITMAVPEAPHAPPREVVAREDAPVDRGARVLISRARRQGGADGGGGAGGGVSGADRVVAVGRGLRRREDLSLVEELCRALDAELGASRPLVEDSRWLPAERQVGLSGHSVKPELYLAVAYRDRSSTLSGCATPRWWWRSIATRRHRSSRRPTSASWPTSTRSYHGSPPRWRPALTELTWLPSPAWSLQGVHAGAAELGGPLFMWPLG